MEKEADSLSDSWDVVGPPKRSQSVLVGNVASSALPQSQTKDRDIVVNKQPVSKQELRIPLQVDRNRKATTEDKNAFPAQFSASVRKEYLGFESNEVCHWVPKSSVPEGVKILTVFTDFTVKATEEGALAKARGLLNGNKE